MPKAAHSLHHPAQTNDPPEARGTHAEHPKPVKDASHGSRGKEKQVKTTKSASAADRAAAIARIKKDTRPLLIGAGLGAAVALTVVALRTKQRAPTLALFASPNSTFLSAVVRAAAFAVERTAAQGTLASLVARAVGRAAAR